MSTSCLSSMEKSNYVEVVRTNCDAVTMRCRELEKNRPGLARRLRLSQLRAEPMRRAEESVRADYSMLQVNQEMSSHEPLTAGSSQDFQLLEPTRRAEESVRADYNMLQLNQGMSSQRPQTAGSPQDFHVLGVARRPARGWILAVDYRRHCRYRSDGHNGIANLNRGTSHRALGIPREGHVGRRGGHQVYGRAGKPGAVSETRSVLPR